jgi:uncharacterized protein YukE
MADQQYGADLEQLAKLESALSTRANELQNAIGELEGRIRPFFWQGPDADQFRQQTWPQGIRAKLDAARARLDQTAKLVRAHIDEQRVASQS